MKDNIVLDRCVPYFNNFLFSHTSSASNSYRYLMARKTVKLKVKTQKYCNNFELKVCFQKYLFFIKLLRHLWL